MIASMRAWVPVFHSGCEKMNRSLCWMPSTRQRAHSSGSICEPGCAAGRTVPAAGRAGDRLDFRIPVALGPIAFSRPILVAVKPGKITDVPMLVSCSSTRSSSIRPQVAYLLTEYTPLPDPANIPLIEHTVAICAPSLCARKRGRKVRTPFTGPQKLTPTPHSQSFIVAVVARALRPTPALFTSRCVLP